MHAIANIDRRTDPYTRSLDLAILFFWLGWLCMLVFIVSINFEQATAMLVFGAAMFGAFATSVRYFMGAHLSDNINEEEYAVDEEDATEHAATQTDAEHIAELKRVHQFLVLVCSGKTSQKQLSLRGFSGVYAEWMREFEKAGVVQSMGAGRDRVVRITNVEEAEAAIARYMGDANYWDDAFPKLTRVSTTHAVIDHSPAVEHHIGTKE